MRAKEEKSMKERRSLVEGLNSADSVDRHVEEQFVLGRKPKAVEAVAPQASPAETKEGKGQGVTAAARVPLTTRIRADYAAALKRASLERQLSGTVPNTLQDILEEALGPWLRSNGYLN